MIYDDFTLIALIVGRVVWTSTYTYILLLFVAAAFIAFIARPRPRGEAQKRLYAGILFGTEELRADECGVSEPRLHVVCLEGGKVLFRRLNIDNLTSSGADSLAVTVTGKDVEITERVSAGYHDDERIAGAQFEVDLTGYEWRHISWTDPESGLWCAFTLHVRQGIDFFVTLRQ